MQSNGASDSGWRVETGHQRFVDGEAMQSQLSHTRIAEGMHRHMALTTTATSPRTSPRRGPRSCPPAGCRCRSRSHRPPWSGLVGWHVAQRYARWLAGKRTVCTRSVVTQGEGAHRTGPMRWQLHWYQYPAQPRSVTNHA